MRGVPAARSQDHVAALRKTLDLDLLVLKSVKSFYVGSNEVDRDEFDVFVAPLMADHQSLFALQWAPRVTDAKRGQFRMAAVRDGYPDFRITEYDAKGNLVPVSRRKEYYPIFFSSLRRMRWIWAWTWPRIRPALRQ